MSEPVLTLYNKEVTVYGASILPAGHGHKKVNVFLKCEYDIKMFSSVTSDMPSIDEIEDIEDYNDKSMAYYNLIESSILYEIDDWVLDMSYDEDEDEE